MALIDKIKELGKYHNLSKHEQLVQGVIDAIEKGELKIGNQLPSINTMVKDIGYARKTIVKAYRELKDRGLVESKKMKGYYIISEETNVTLRVALLLFAFQSIQEEFYNTFRNELGKRFQIDVFFHHNNISIFETILSNIKDKYGMYVIAPIQDSRIPAMLQGISAKKLLIVDRYLPLGNEISYISQEFECSIYNKLIELLPEIRTFNRVVLFNNQESDYTPLGISRAFERFTSENNINGRIEKDYELGSVRKGELYFILKDSILWNVLKDCVNGNLKIGKDVGILSQDDSVAKEIVFGGITTTSSDFKLMAKMAAHHLMHDKITHFIMPFNLIRRNSL